MSLVRLILLCLLLAGCILPRSAPTAGKLEGRIAGGNEVGFEIVQVTPKVAGVIAADSGPGLRTVLAESAEPDQYLLGPGDVVTITIYEPAVSADPVAGTPGFAGRSTVLPPQVIGKDGRVSIPYVGKVNIAGRSLIDAGRKISWTLVGKAVQPQVIVTMDKNVSSVAMVGGEVNVPGPVTLSQESETLLNVLVKAGGTKHPAFESRIRLIRQSVAHEIPALALLSDPANNDIPVRAGDKVFVTRNPLTFTVLGASERVNQFDFNAEHITLAEALARAGGPIDALSDLRGIYLFRYETPAIAEAVRGKARAPAAEGESSDQMVPILYRINMSDASGYFLAQKVTIRDKDIILIAQAQGPQLQKLFALIRGGTGIFFDVKRSSSLP
jgi:polysaccharide export outer membrane protein